MSVEVEWGTQGFPRSSAGKESTCNVGDLGSIPGLERPSGEGKGYPLQYSWASLCGSDGKESACDVGDLGSIPGLERPPGEGKGYLLQYSGIVHGVAQSDTTKRLSLHFTNTFYFFSVFFLSGIYLNSFYCCVFKFIYLLVISNLPLVICSVL